MIRTVYSPLLRAWFNVRGPHQTPIGGSYASKADALAALAHAGRVRAGGPREPR